MIWATLRELEGSYWFTPLTPTPDECGANGSAQHQIEVCSLQSQTQNLSQAYRSRRSAFADAAATLL
jgi:hypothetical protein